MTCIRIAAVLIAFAISGIVSASPPPGLTAGSKNISVDSGFAVATLSNAGSFEFSMASMYTSLAMRAHLATSALKAHKITAAQAQARHDQLAAVKKLLDASLAACQQDNKSGTCTGNRPLAVKLEHEAKAAYRRLPADPKF